MRFNTEVIGSEQDAGEVTLSLRSVIIVAVEVLQMGRVPQDGRVE